jgi:hypothetical protein
MNTTFTLLHGVYSIRRWRIPNRTTATLDVPNQAYDSEATSLFLVLKLPSVFQKSHRTRRIEAPSTLTSQELRAIPLFPLSLPDSAKEKPHTDHSRQSLTSLESDHRG